MTTRWFGAPVQRNEDPRLLRGQGIYVDDIDLPDMLHAAVLRSPYARASIKHIDTSAALALSGVHLVLTDRRAAGRRTIRQAVDGDDRHLAEHLVRIRA